MVAYFISNEVGISEPARRIIWDTFFKKANRGVDFESHLPWSSDRDTRCVSLLNEKRNLVAAAIIRPAQQRDVAMVGFVCVEPSVRGQGVGSQLVSAVNVAIDEAGFRASLLWTARPHVYERAGYARIGRDVFYQISGLPENRRLLPDLSITSWPYQTDRVGLPAFAVSAKRIKSKFAEAIVAEGARGVTLINWAGPPSDVCAIMAAANYTSWGVNLPEGAAFEQALSDHGLAINGEKGAFVMARQASELVSLDYVPVAERI